MPISHSLSPDRCEFRDPVTPTELDRLAGKPEVQVLQAAEPVSLSTWEMLNDRFFSKRPDVELRVYGFYGQVCDLSFVSRMTNVRRFGADCLYNAVAVEQIRNLSALETLGIGIYDLEDLSFLDDLDNSRLTEISVMRSRSKKPSLAVLERFHKITKLYLEGQQKDIEVIGQLSRLEDLTLRSITVPDLNFLRGLDRLWSVDIKLGGTTNLSALEGMNGIKYLELWQIKGMSDLSSISRMRGLQYLFLQSLRQLQALPDMSALHQLRRLYLENLMGLTDLTSIGSAPALEELMHVSAQGLDPVEYANGLETTTVKRASVGFGSLKKNEQFTELTRLAGIEEYRHTPFQFR